MAEADFLRREIASRMHERLQLVKVNPLRVLDAGCGTGPDLPVLQKSYPAAQVLGVDTSPAMIAAARGQAAKSGLSQLIGKLLPAKSGIDYLCADMADCRWRATMWTWSGLTWPCTGTRSRTACSRNGTGC